jgi:hypothetical protein
MWIRYPLSWTQARKGQPIQQPDDCSTMIKHAPLAGVCRGFGSNFLSPPPPEPLKGRVKQLNHRFWIFSGSPSLAGSLRAGGVMFSVLTQNFAPRNPNFAE